MNSPSQELLPCPFCGSNNTELSNTHTPYFTVTCLDCDAEKSGEYFASAEQRKDRFSYSENPNNSGYEASFDQLHPEYRQAALSAIEAWNTRPQLLLQREGNVVTDKVCSRCLGSGEQEYLSDSSPHAYEVMGNCSECGGTGEAQQPTAPGGEVVAQALEKAAGIVEGRKITNQLVDQLLAHSINSSLDDIAKSIRALIKEPQ